MRALLVEDHPTLASHTRQALKVGGFEVDVVVTLDDADAAVAVTNYVIILLDRQLPDGDGLDWLRRFRAGRDTTPVIVMTAARRDLRDRVQGLNDGADDYLVKPVEFEELVARVRAVLRRPKALENATLVLGDIAFNTVTREVAIGGEPVMLPRREMCLLENLMRRSGHIVPRASLEENLYGYDGEVTPNAIEVSVHRLRRALKMRASTVKVHTVRGIGYMLVDDAPPAHPARPAAPLQHGV